MFSTALKSDSTDDIKDVGQNWRLAWIIIFILCLATLLHGQEAKLVESCGDVLLYTLPATAAGMTWAHHDLTGLVQWSGAGAMTVATTFLLKRTTNAKRPNGEKYSFPSGHTSISFFAAEFVRRRYGSYWGAPLYAAATFVAYSRIHARKHYLRDVIAGAAIGIGFSYMLTSNYFKKPLPNDYQLAEASVRTMPTPLRLSGWNVQVGIKRKTWRLWFGRCW